MRALMRRIALIVALGLLGCGHKEDSKPSATGSATIPASGVEIFVDDTSIAHVATSQVATWPRLDTLVPVTARHLGSWQELSVKGSAGTTQLHKPADKYRDLVPVLYPGDGGKPAFGMFDPVELANHGKPKVGAADVAEIRIILASGGGRGENESGDGGGQDPEKLSIAIKTPAGESTLDGPKLLAITREPLPGDDSKELRGWSLETLLDAAGIKKFEKLMLTDVSGQALSLEPADLDPARSIPFVKLNRQGSLRVTVFKKQGEGWTRGGGLRGLVSIEVLK
jgi:hypothetical protein